jgi:general secretion pathway protein G
MEPNTQTGRLVGRRDDVQCTRRGGSFLRQRGFTMVEMVIVISIMLILISIGVPIYTRSIVRAKEAVLHDQLFTMRQLIDEYTMDKQQAPQSLDDLVTEGYLRELPKDPLTNSKSSWKVDMEDTLKAADQTQPGVVDVHSGATGTSLEGSAYSTW